MVPGYLPTHMHMRMREMRGLAVLLAHPHQASSNEESNYLLLETFNTSRQGLNQMRHMRTYGCEDP